MKVLVIDIGGTNIKFQASGQPESSKFPSGPSMAPGDMVRQVLDTAQGWEFDQVSIGYPGPVVDGRPELEPKNLKQGWVGYDLAAQFGKPTKVVNDAAMQALGSYEGGRMLFLGLGTGLGSAMVLDNILVPLELAHLPYRKKRTFEDYVGRRGLERLGESKWRRAVIDVATRLKAALIAEYVVFGGGNARLLRKVPAWARIGGNENAITGGIRLWETDSSGVPRFRPQGESALPEESVLTS